MLWKSINNNEKQGGVKWEHTLELICIQAIVTLELSMSRTKGNLEKDYPTV
jgi:hypothetical protein